MGLQVVLVDELPMEFWRKSRTKCVFEREQMHETLCFSRQSASPNVDARNPMFFSILALVIFLLNILLKSVSKSSFFRSGVEIPGFGATISDAVARSSIVFCNSVSADRIVMAASRLLRAVAACVIPLSFAAGSRQSSWSGAWRLRNGFVSRFAPFWR